MVRAAPEQSVQAPPTQTDRTTGRGHGGFPIALLIASPVAMLACFSFVGLLMTEAQGGSSAFWLGSMALFGGLGLIFTFSLVLAEASDA